MKYKLKNVGVANIDTCFLVCVTFVYKTKTNIAKGLLAVWRDWHTKKDAKQKDITVS